MLKHLEIDSHFYIFFKTYKKIKLYSLSNTDSTILLLDISSSPIWKLKRKRHLTYY